MKTEAIAAYRAVKAAHVECVKQFVALEKALETACGNNPQEVADIAFALREMYDLLETTRKQTAAIGKTAQQVACLLSIASGNAGTIGTAYVAATPNVRTIPAIPKRRDRPQEFAALMDYLKIPRDLWEKGDHAIVDFHWPGLVDKLTNDAANGLPLPPGIDPTKTFAEYSLRMRTRKEVDA